MNARLVLPANTNIKIMLRLPLANIVKLERNLNQQQITAHLVVPANTKMNIMFRLPLAKIVPKELLIKKHQKNVVQIVQQVNE